MKLSRHTDYAFRIMIHLAVFEGELISSRRIAQAYGISQNHLMKIVQSLGRAGFIETVRGRYGGLRLARPAPEIAVGAIMRHTEGDSDFVPCGQCLISPACGLPCVLGEAMEAFLRVLDGYSLGDIANRPGMLRDLFHGATAPTREYDREGRSMNDLTHKRLQDISMKREGARCLTD